MKTLSTRLVPPQSRWLNVLFNGRGDSADPHADWMPVLQRRELWLYRTEYLVRNSSEGGRCGAVTFERSKQNAIQVRMLDGQIHSGPENVTSGIDDENQK
ncbi:hypothetical protein F2P81_024094 [Scophthalmus maximus]|uniref:Uncharacterized protein n=1 Tax=Scophthalmus maximus TaxID=52904 RepID=A0A6A4RYG2_SCOMX|nr:hypothetical protein F2P81_024094 [Scophthalmus maximus]